MSLLVDLLVHVPPEHAAHLRKAGKQFEQGMPVAQADGLHPEAVDGHRMMVQAYQMMLVRRLGKRVLEQLQLLVGQVPRRRTCDGGIEQRHPPGTDVHHRLQPLRALRGLLHDRRLVVIAGQPAHRRGNSRCSLGKRQVGSQRAVLRQVAGGDQQIDVRLFRLHLADHLSQALPGIQAEHGTLCFGYKVAVRQLHEQHRGIDRAIG